MTGEELLFLVWVFLGFCLLFYTAYYIRRQRTIERYREFAQSMVMANRALKKMKVIHWVDHINIPEAYKVYKPTPRYLEGEDY